METDRQRLTSFGEMWMAAMNRPRASPRQTDRQTTTWFWRTTRRRLNRRKTQDENNPWERLILQMWLTHPGGHYWASSDRRTRKTGGKETKWQRRKKTDLAGPEIMDCLKAHCVLLTNDESNINLNSHERNNKKELHPTYLKYVRMKTVAAKHTMDATHPIHVRMLSANAWSVSRGLLTFYARFRIKTNRKWWRSNLFPKHKKQASVASVLNSSDRLARLIKINDEKQNQDFGETLMRADSPKCWWCRLGLVMALTKQLVFTIT